MVLVGDGEGHITYLSCSLNDTESQAKVFLNAFGKQLSEQQRHNLHKVIGWDNTMKNVSFKVGVNPIRSEEEEAKHRAEQIKVREDINKLAFLKMLESEGQK